MDVYEKMWKGFVQRVFQSAQFSISRTFTHEDIINLMAIFENEFKEEIELLNELQEDEDEIIPKPAGNESGTEPAPER